MQARPPTLVIRRGSAPMLKASASASQIVEIRKDGYRNPEIGGVGIHSCLTEFPRRDFAPQNAWRSRNRAFISDSPLYPWCGACRGQGGMVMRFEGPERPTITR